MSVTSLAEVWIEIQIWYHTFHNYCVTSLAEVWIEIASAGPAFDPNKSLPLRKCGLKFEAWGWPYEYISHFPCGSVDWNIFDEIRKTGPFSHFPCGSVDWNRTAEHYAECRKVTSLAEVWIEISSSVAVQSMSWPSLPLRKCGLKWLKMFCTFVLCWVTSLAEVWIEITLLRGWRNDERSLPLRKCGLKFVAMSLYYMTKSSLPLRKCGLK